MPALPNRPVATISNCGEYLILFSGGSWPAGGTTFGNELHSIKTICWTSSSRKRLLRTFASQTVTIPAIPVLQESVTTQRIKVLRSALGNYVKDLARILEPRLVITSSVN